MLKRIFLAFVAFASATSAVAGPKPPDVAEYSPVAATYAAGTTLNTLGGTGVPPVELVDIPTPNPNDYVATGSGVLTDWAVPPKTEAKTRANFESTHINWDDAIRNYGLPGTAHCHQYFGNRWANGFSTYATLRTGRKAESRSWGNRLWASAYWHPCFIKENAFGDSKNYAVRTDLYVLYYGATVGGGSNFTYLPVGIRFVGGVHMDDPDDSQVSKEIAAANAQTGTAGRYLRLWGPGGGPRYSGNQAEKVIYQCLGGGSTSSFLRNSDGTAALSCAAGDPIQFSMSFPECWDGVNLWSPDGYSNMRYTIWDTVAGKAVCPNGWRMIVAISGYGQLSHSGTADFKEWTLDSDAQAQAKLDSLPTCNASWSNAPCKDAARTLKRGQSLHYDYLYGMDKTIATEWQRNCTGLEGYQQHLCGSGAISDTQTLLHANVRENLIYGTSSPDKMWLIGTAHKGPGSITHSGN